MIRQFLRLLGVLVLALAASCQKGGAGGGESTLNPRAVALLEKFHALKKGFDDMVNVKFIELDF